MKKFFAFVAAALVAFSFASCNKGGNANFKIAVSNITATSADVAITPEDETVAYFWSYVSKATLEEYDMTLDEWAADDMEFYPAYGYTFEQMASYGLSEYSFTSLDPETEYYVYVFVFNENFEILSDVDYVAFTTPKVQETGKKTLTLTNGICDDHCADHGWWQLMIADADTTYYLSISPNQATQLAGSYTLADMDADYTYIYDLEVGTSKASFTTFNATTTAENGIFHLTGKGLASNGIEYTLDLTGEVTTSNSAPAAAPKKVAKKLGKQLVKRLPKK